MPPAILLSIMDILTGVVSGMCCQIKDFRIPFVQFFAEAALTLCSQATCKLSNLLVADTQFVDVIVKVFSLLSSKFGIDSPLKTQSKRSLQRARWVTSSAIQWFSVLPVQQARFSASPSNACFVGTNQSCLSWVYCSCWTNKDLALFNLPVLERLVRSRGRIKIKFTLFMAMQLRLFGYS